MKFQGSVDFASMRYVPSGCIRMWYVCSNAFRSALSISSMTLWYSRVPFTSSRIVILLLSPLSCIVVYFHWGMLASARTRSSSSGGRIISYVSGFVPTTLVFTVSAPAGMRMFTAAAVPLCSLGMYISPLLVSNRFVDSVICLHPSYSLICLILFSFAGVRCVL